MKKKVFSISTAILGIVVAISFTLVAAGLFSDFGIKYAQKYNQVLAENTSIAVETIVKSSLDAAEAMVNATNETFASKKQ